jgi:hypothetical protein
VRYHVWRDEEDPPSLGVREPRKPRPKQPFTRTAAEPEVELPPALAAVSAGSCMTREAE